MVRLTIISAGASRLNITNNGGDDLADEATAEARLRQEAQTQQKNSYAPPLNRGIRDVTADFVAATRKLPPGELVKDEYFTLFEAVGALEVSIAYLHLRISPRRASYHNGKEKEEEGFPEAYRPR